LKVLNSKLDEANNMIRQYVEKLKVLEIVIEVEEEEMIPV